MIARGVLLARVPDHRARAGQPPLPVAVQHGSAGEDDRGQVHGARGHDTGGRGLVAAGGEHDAVDGVAVKHLDQAQVGQVAVQRRGGTFALLRDGVDRKLEGQAAGVADALLDALGQFHVDVVTRRQVAAGLCDADDRLARLEFFARPAVVHVTLDIGCSHGEIVGVVEPFLAAQFALDLREVFLHDVCILLTPGGGLVYATVRRVRPQ